MHPCASFLCIIKHSHCISLTVPWLTLGITLPEPGHDQFVTAGGLISDLTMHIGWQLAACAFRILGSNPNFGSPTALVDGVFTGIGKFREGMSGIIDGDAVGAVIGVKGLVQGVVGGGVNFASSAIGALPSSRVKFPHLNRIALNHPARSLQGAAGETLDSIFILKPAGFLLSSVSKTIMAAGTTVGLEGEAAALHPLRFGRFFGPEHQMTTFNNARRPAIRYESSSIAD